MAGHVFRRCTTCGRRFDTDDHDRDCQGSRFTWAFRIDVSTTTSNGRSQRRGGGFPSRKAAERAMREILAKVDNASYVPTSERTLQQFLEVEWLPIQLPPKTSPNRYRNKRHAINRIKPLIGDVRLQLLTPADLERAYAVLLQPAAAVSGHRARKAFAPSTVVQTHGVIRQALQDGVKWGLVERNVADQADPPSNAIVRAARRQAMKVWTPTQLADFLEAARDHWLWPMWLLLATTGLRRGELAGIVDDSLDVKAATLSVGWQLVPEEDLAQPGRTRPVHKAVAKTAASHRIVNLDHYTTGVLAEAALARNRTLGELGLSADSPPAADACSAGHPEGAHGQFAFCWPDGRHLNPDWISHEFKRLRRAASVPDIRLHDVRHTHASLLLASGEHLKVVQERLGWTTAAFMLDTYTHLLPGMQAEAAERFASAILPVDRRDPGA